jgi:subtilisin family serine protease
VFPQGEVLEGHLLRLVDRPFTRRLTNVQVLVEFDEEPPPGPMRPHLDIRINAGTGRVRSAYLPIARLPELTAAAGVRRVHPSLTLYRRMERAVGAVGAGGLERLRGRARYGVVIGIVDSGIDSAHSDIRGRIVRYWDQTIHGPGVEGAGYGVEHRTSTEMRESPDESGHGTHLAGIAAGAGTGPDGTAGVNPGAKLVVVKTGFTEAEVLDGVRYVRDVARDLGLPAVVNLSLGGHAGPHDGRGPLSRAIDGLCGPGFLVCAAAGNEGAIPIHARCRLSAGGNIALPVRLNPARGLREPEAHLYGWAEVPADGHLEVAMAGPEADGATPVTPFREPLREGLSLGSYPLADGFVRIALPPVDEGEQGFIVDIVPGGEALHPGPWMLRLRNVSPGPADLHLWSGEHPEGPAADLTGETVDSRSTIGEPGDARGAITVGAWTTRLDWDSDAGPQERPGRPGDVPEFSSRGPLRGGVGGKPDFVAPGEWLVASRSGAAPAEGDRAVGRRRLVLRGTSQAAAFASGWISLLLAEDPDLGPEEMREKLRAATTRPEGADPDLWGEGHLGTE